MNKEVKIIFTNGKVLGKAIMEVDGFYYFLPAPQVNNFTEGLWSEHGLRYVADKLEELNKPWNEHLNKHLNE